MARGIFKKYMTSPMVIKLNCKCDKSLDFTREKCKLRVLKYNSGSPARHDFVSRTVVSVQITQFFSYYFTKRKRSHHSVSPAPFFLMSFLMLIPMPRVPILRMSFEMQTRETNGLRNERFRHSRKINNENRAHWNTNIKTIKEL